MAQIVPNYSAFRKRNRLGGTTDPGSAVRRFCGQWGGAKQLVLEGYPATVDCFYRATTDIESVDYG